MEDSILLTIKTLLGIGPEHDSFDEEIKIHINTAFMMLNQIGVGPPNGFYITGKDEVWKDFTDRMDIEAIKTYIYLRVRLLFDPPQMGYLVTVLREQIEEFEWRLNVQVENSKLPGGQFPENNSDTLFVKVRE